MLRGRLLNLRSTYLPRFYVSQRARDARLLTLLESTEPLDTRISAALNDHLYALAALLVSNEAAGRPQASLLRLLVRGLSAYDPRLVPVNLRALHVLHTKARFEMDSAEKAVLIDSLLEYGDPEATRSGLDLLRRVDGGPVPVSALMAVCAHARAVDSPSTLVYLWYYLRQAYPRTLFEYSSLIVDLLETFSRNERYRPLAREVAQACVVAPNPSIALAVAKTSYMLRDDELAARLCASLGTVDAPVANVLSQLDVVKGRRPRTDVLALPAQEMAGAVKGVARRNVAAGEQLVAASSVQPNHTKHRERLAKTALCNQHIHAGDFAKFMSTFRELQALRLGSGVLLNLRITWELHHGTFAAAKRHYQNWARMPQKQRAIALKALATLADGDDSAMQWVRAEKRMHGLR